MALGTRAARRRPLLQDRGVAFEHCEVTQSLLLLFFAFSKFLFASHFFAAVDPFWADGIVLAPRLSLLFSLFALLGTIVSSVFGHEHVVLERRATLGRNSITLVCGSLAPDKVSSVVCVLDSN